MRFVSPFLKRVVYPSMSGAGWFRRASSAGLAVVTYHGLLPEGYQPIDDGLDGNLVSKVEFRRQLQLLKAGYTVISPEEMLAWVRGARELPPRAVLLTCDDGLLNCLTDMLPILQQENLRSLFFVTGNSLQQTRAMLWYEELLLMLMGSPGQKVSVSVAGVALEAELGSRERIRAEWWEWVKGLSQIEATARISIINTVRSQLRPTLAFQLNDRCSPICRRFGLMTASELRQLRDAGMTIGAHTLTHPMLSQMSPEMAKGEMLASRTALESFLETPVWALAYPFGDPHSVSPQIFGLARESGFEAAFVNYGGGLGSDLSLYALPRIHVTAEMKLSEFEAHVSGFYSRLQRRAARVAQVSATGVCT